MLWFLITYLLFSLAFLVFSYRRLLRYLRYFQQEEYSAERFLAWYINNRAYDKRATLALAALFLLTILELSNTWIFLAGTAGFIGLLYLEPNPLKTGKIKLNLTARAQRILLLAIFIFLFTYFLETNYSGFGVLYLILVIQLLPLTLVLANFLLIPFEKYTKNQFKQEAKSILRTINPFVIGITGSYGKTSVKAALGEVLNNCLAPTFCPPKSINTEMGITREIRENLKPGHKYAVIEMGAYNVGSIQRLCNLTPPKAGLVTMVGLAHLERYGSPERIYQAKSELAQNIPADGILVCNGDNPGARKMAQEFPKQTTLLYGLDQSQGPLNCYARKLSSSSEGTKFEVTWEDKTYLGQTKLLGLPALSNLIGVFTMSVALGANPDFVLASISNIKPVDNRLSLSKEGQVIFLRDAYNSNPTGFAAALDVLAELPANRRILMTPGMIELGNRQFDENNLAAQKAAKVCDLILLVGQTNRQALQAGLDSMNFPADRQFFCETRSAAFARLNQILQNGDVVLIENDLTDLYEVSESF